MEIEKPLFPLIEAVTNDATWKVLPNKSKGWHGASSIEIKTIAVPVDNSEEALGTRTHELCHVAYSPSITAAKKLALEFDIQDFDWVLSCEDGRVQSIAHGKGIIFPSLLSALYKTEKNINLNLAEKLDKDFEQFIKLCVATIGTPDHKYYLSQLDTSGTTKSFKIIFNQIERILATQKFTFLSTIVCAKYLESYFEHEKAKHEEKEKISSERSMFAEGASKLISRPDYAGDLSSLTDSLRELESLIYEKSAEENVDTIKSVFDRSTYKIRETNRWGKLEVIENPRPNNMLKHCRIAPKKRIGEYGTSPTAMHRWCSDQNVFVTKVHMPGGTLLVDTSGSMGFISDQIYDIAKIAPMITIATYCGAGARGELWVVAKNGMLADGNNLCSHMSGNIIDGPALEWLGAQKEPRIWICDGQVTGINDRQAANLNLDAKNIVKKYSIVRVNNIEEAQKVFKLIEQKRFREVYGFSKD